jgi:hypothetical protein
MLGGNHAGSSPDCSNIAAQSNSNRTIPALCADVHGERGDNCSKLLAVSDNPTMNV